MPRQTKMEVAGLAKQLARGAVNINNLEEAKVLEKMDGTAKTELARTLLNKVAPQVEADIQDRFVEHFRKEFQGQVFQDIGSAIGNLQNRRARFKKMCEWTRVEDALVTLRRAIQECRVRGASIDQAWDGVRLSVKRAGGSVEAEASFEFERNFSKVARNPDDKNQLVGQFELTVHLNWSGSTRTLASAVANAALNVEICNVASEVMTRMERERVVWTRGVTEGDG